MKITPYRIIAIAALSFLGLSGLIYQVMASSPQRSSPTVSQPQNPSSQAQKMQTSDGDGEMDEAGEKSEQLKSQTNPENDRDEANEGPNDQDGGQKEDAH
jgi:hypothetical protein